MTEYVVISSKDGTAWEERGTAKGASANAAIRQFINMSQLERGISDTLYVAIPARSWNPVTVATETQTRLVIGKPETAVKEPMPE